MAILLDVWDNTPNYRKNISELSMVAIRGGAGSRTLDQTPHPLECIVDVQMVAMIYCENRLEQFIGTQSVLTCNKRKADV